MARAESILVPLPRFPLLEVKMRPLQNAGPSSPSTPAPGSLPSWLCPPFSQISAARGGGTLTPRGSWGPLGHPGVHGAPSLLLRGPCEAVSQEASLLSSSLEGAPFLGIPVPNTDFKELMLMCAKGCCSALEAQQSSTRRYQGVLGLWAAGHSCAGCSLPKAPGFRHQRELGANLSLASEPCPRGVRPSPAGSSSAGRDIGKLG